MSLLNFDASQVQPATGEMEPVPAAWYDVVIDQSETKPTKDGATTGNAFLECRMNIIGGQYTGRKLFSRFNIRNSNPVAQEIAYKELSAVCHATGVLQVQDSQQLHGIPFKVKVKVRAADGQYGASNEVTTYKPANFVPDAPVAGGAPAGAMPPQQQAWAAPAAAHAAAQAPAGWAPPAAAPVAPPQWQAPPQPPAAPPQATPQWQAPAAPQQPWQAGPPAAQPPVAPPVAPPQAPAQPWAGAPGATATPPWQRPPGQ